MKKILFVLVLIFITNLGCKKITNGGGLCACSPISYDTSLGLVIKNSADVDLLNPKTTGFLDKTQIQLYSKDASNVIKQINFDIRQPFTYTNNLKLDYYQLISYEIGLQAKSIDNAFYLKLGDKLYELNLKVNNRAVEKLLIDKVDAPKELPNINSQYLNSIYTLKI
ncbi:hypothetical protein ASU31_09400 [Pedobacter ginsenosidimutans]|uniref:Uncharacterized protein n=1 Tax=Pedobacter ginsenosidimutans TaxID=687842 RepID=A0A0T5VR81_9SPHI|nr:hypothetical protein [Pedobacter ginsenosidimutans]KRT16374.1 hypothetical protein ASU31_09400 [Pedobacter ginsenosidimutans]